MDKAENKRRVIFLDIDGVLQPDWHRERFKHDRKKLQQELAEKYLDQRYLKIDEYDVAAVYYDWDAGAVQNLKTLLAEGAEIVLHSNWRDTISIENLRLLFKLHDLPLHEVVPAVGVFHNKVQDIKAYLAANEGLEYYVILDDLDMGKDFPGHFVWHHSPKDCMGEREMQQAKTILKYGAWWDLAMEETRWADDYNYRNKDSFHDIHDGLKKVIFLDFDGVLNDDLGSRGDNIAVHPEAIKLLKRIVKKTNADIIMSSSRRFAYGRFVKSGFMGGCSDLALKDFKLFQELMDKECLSVRGQTPEIGSGPYARPAEIRA